MLGIPPELISVMQAINAGEKDRARRLLTPLLKANPTAEMWYQASRLTEKPEHEIACLKQALGLDPYHVEARRRYRQLQPETAPPAVPPTAPMSTAAPQAARAASSPAQSTQSQPTPTHPDLPVKKVRHRRQRGTWFYVGIVGSILLSLSASYFVMLVLGSSVPGQLRSLLGGAAPITEIDGVPLEQVPDAVMKIPPSLTNVVTQQEPLAEILEPGIVHEYTFKATAGEEVAVGIQFFSPTAQRVNRNIAILDPEGQDADRLCHRDRILQGDNGAAIICSIHRSGTWQVRLLGREGESSGAYVVSIGRIYE